jgi:hypothetical protein
MFEPQTGGRHAMVKETRTKRDFADCLKYLLDEKYASVSKVRLVLDNLNTHTPAALYETFPFPEALRLAKRIEWHYTPLHGSWLNMVEIELSVLVNQCLNRRIGDIEQLREEIAGWRAGAQCSAREGPVAFYSSRCADQTETFVPVT